MLRWPSLRAPTYGSRACADRCRRSGTTPARSPRSPATPAAPGGPCWTRPASTRTALARGGRLPGPVRPVPVRDRPRQRVRGAGQGRRLRRTAAAAARDARRWTSPSVGYTDLDGGGNDDRATPARHATRGPGPRCGRDRDGAALFDHPLLRLRRRRAGTCTSSRTWSRSGTDGQVPRRRDQVVRGDRRAGRPGQGGRGGDPGGGVRARAARAARQPTTRSSHEIVLVCPENFANRPVAVKVDVRKQLTVLRAPARAARPRRVDPGRPSRRTSPSTWPATGRRADPAAGGTGAALGASAPATRPSACRRCELAFFCRDEAGRATAALGSQRARGARRGRDGRRGARAGRRHAAPADDQAEVAAMLRTGGAGVRRKPAGAALTRDRVVRAGPCGRHRPGAADRDRAARAPVAASAGLRAADTGRRGERAAGRDGRHRPRRGRLLVVPQPRNRDQRFAFAAELADVVLPYVDSYVHDVERCRRRRAERPRSPTRRRCCVPNPAGVAVRRAVRPVDPVPPHRRASTRCRPTCRCSAGG